MSDTSHYFAEWVTLSYCFQLGHMPWRNSILVPTPQSEKETIMVVMNIPLYSSYYAGNIFDSQIIPGIISSGLSRSNRDKGVRFIRLPTVIHNQS